MTKNKLKALGTDGYEDQPYTTSDISFGEVMSRLPTGKHTPLKESKPPKTIFLPNQQVIRMMIRSVAHFRNDSLEVLLARFGF